MANIIPEKVEYNLEIMNHTMKAVAEHLELARRITFFFDDKIVSEKAVPPGDFTTDDDCISDLVAQYSRNQNGVYADIFKRHSDKVHLVSKVLDFTIDYYGIKMNAHIVVEKEKYNIKVTGNNGEDNFEGVFKSTSFSDVLEKVRLFTNTLEGISEGLSSHIDELSNDKVEQWIKWN